MGGTGSGRWTYYNKKCTVEECWAIGISEIARIIDPSQPGAQARSLWPTTPKTGERMSPVRCSLERDADGAMVLTLSYVLDNRWGIDRRVEQVVPLQTTQPNFGGVRWWFGCPRAVNGGKVVVASASSTALREVGALPAVLVST